MGTAHELLASLAESMDTPRRSPGPQALDNGERAAGLQVINRAGYDELSIGQIRIRELDENRYWCSLSSMYRIAAAAGQTRERRRQTTRAIALSVTAGDGGDEVGGRRSAWRVARAMLVSPLGR